MNTVLTRDEIRDIVASISYKPGFKIELTKIDAHSCEFDVQMQVKDTYKPGNTIVHSTHCFSLGYFGRKEHLIEFIRHAITTLELHERDEWFKVDGKLLNDPHKKELV